MSAPELTLEIADHIAVMRLNRPQSMNSYTAAMGQLWDQALQQCNDDDNVRVVIITGNGNAFCAGADMSQAGSTFDKQADMDFSSNPVMPAWQCRKPVIAAMNGHAVGLGFSLALQCDFRIAAKEGKYGLLQVQRGVLADGCTHWLLPRLVGMEKALEIMLFGDKMSGEDLLEAKLASQCVSADKVFDTAMVMAKRLASQSSPLITAMAKRLMWQSLHMSLEAMEAKETQWLHHTMGLDDAIEGGMAYFEKRPPNWQASVSHHWPEKT